MKPCFRATDALHLILEFRNLNSVAMLLPSVEEQQAIASKIEALEAKIKQAQTIIDNSKARKEAVLKAYL